MKRAIPFVILITVAMFTPAGFAQATQASDRIETVTRVYDLRDLMMATYPPGPKRDWWLEWMARVALETRCAQWPHWVRNASPGFATTWVPLPGFSFATARNAAVEHPPDRSGILSTFGALHLGA